MGALVGCLNREGTCGLGVGPAESIQGAWPELGGGA